MSLSSSRLLGLVALSAVCAVGCASDPSRPKLFSTDWVDDRGRSIAEVQTRLRSSAPPVTVDIAVAVAGRADRVVGMPLAGGARWVFEHPLDARPILAGGVVVISGGGEVVALDTMTGKKLWARPTGGVQLLGAGDDGRMTAMTLSRGAASTLLVVGRDGQIRRQIETDKQLGAPAVVAGVVLVPWANQYVSAIDASTGDEIGRVVVRDKVTRVLEIGNAVYLGEAALVRFDEKIPMASSGGASRVSLPSRELPGTPRLLAPGNEKLPAAATARDRDRLFARPAAVEGGRLGIDSGRFYASYFQLVMGFDAARGTLTWVHTHPDEVLGGEAITGGVALCDEAGKLSVLDARDGRIAAEQSFGEPIKSCVVHADTFRAPASPAGAPPLAEQIREALATREATLATAQRLLLRELATDADAGATKTLLDVASDPRAAPVLIADARSAIASRRTGAEHMLASLARHYDFLRDVLLSPPVGPIADALAAMKETRAAPLLASHLLDPADSDDDVKRAAAALATLATKDDLPVLKQFFAMYRGTAETEDVALAVASVGAALLRVDPKDGRALVEGAVKDLGTVETARERLQALLTARASKEGAAKADAGAPAP